MVSFEVASGAVHWTWQPDDGFGFMVASTAGNGVVAAAFFNDGTHHIARLDSNGQATFDAWTWPGFPIQYGFGDMWLAQGSVEAISAPGLLWPFSVWPEPGGEPTRTSKRKIKLEVFEVESATTTQDFIQQRVNSGIDYWLANGGILIDWDNTIQVIPDCATTPCLDTDVQNLASIRGNPGTSKLLERFPDRTSSIIVLFNVDLGGVDGLTAPLSFDFPTFFSNITVLPSTAKDALPHELGHIFDLFHVLDPSNLMCGQQNFLEFILPCTITFSRRLTTEQIDTARGNALRFKPTGGN